MKDTDNKRPSPSGRQPTASGRWSAGGPGGCTRPACCAAPGFCRVFCWSGWAWRPWQFWISLLGGALGGLLGGQVLGGMFDTVFRILRGDRTPWRQSYAAAWKQNWKDALLPGALAADFWGCGPG